MAFKPYNFKLNTENPAEAALIERIEGMENKSLLFKAALYHYFEMPPPPPPAEPSPPPSAPAIDYQQLGEVMYQAMRQALSEIQIAIPTGAPMNLEDMTPEPIKTKKQAVLDDILAGLDEWSTTR